MVHGCFSPPELSSCFHGNPCLAADLLCAGKREGEGRSGRRNGWLGGRKGWKLDLQGWFHERSCWCVDVGAAVTLWGVPGGV